MIGFGSGAIELMALWAECRCFLYACALGCAIGMLFSVFSGVRRAFYCPVWLVAAQDVLFWLLAGGATFLFCLRACDGRLRWFVLLGELLGAVAFYRLAGRAFVRLIAWLLRLLLLPLQAAWRLLAAVTRPLRRRALRLRGKAAAGGKRLLAAASARKKRLLTQSKRRKKRRRPLTAEAVVVQNRKI